jgi:hypothetical protein
VIQVHDLVSGARISPEKSLAQIDSGAIGNFIEHNGEMSS